MRVSVISAFDLNCLFHTCRQKNDENGVSGDNDEFMRQNEKWGV